MSIRKNKNLFLSAVLIAFSFTFTGCPDSTEKDTKNTNPSASVSKEAVPFTGELEQIDGVLFAYTIRHPRLINEDYEKLVKEIPEAAAAKFLLSQLVPFGYPQFTEIEGETNLGIFIIADDMETIEDQPSIIVAGKVKEGGKIWNFIDPQTVHKTHNGWTFFSLKGGEEMLDKVKNFDALITYLQKKQETDVKAFLRFDEKIVADIEKKITKELKESLEQEDELTSSEKNAIEGYINVLINQVKQIHSVSYTADLQDKQAQVKGSIQFKPESAWGTFARYPATQDIPQAKYVSNDALISMVFRSNPYGAEYLIKHITSQLMTVDYAPAKDWLTSLDAMYTDMTKKSSGTSFGTFDVIPDLKNRRQPIKLNTFIVSPGAYTTEDFRKNMQNYVSETNSLVKKFINRISDDEETSDAVAYTYNQEAAKIEGINFDSFGISIKNHDEKVTQDIYLFGVASDGSIIMSMETPNFDGSSTEISNAEAVLKEKLPDYLNKTENENSLYKAFVLKENDLGYMHINGDKIVDIVLSAIKDPLTDEDTKVAIASFKNKYKESGPISIGISAEQANMSYTINIPYSFVSNSISFSQYIIGKRFNFLDLPFLGNAYDDDSDYYDGNESYDDEVEVDAIIEQYNDEDGDNTQKAEEAIIEIEDEE